MQKIVEFMLGKYADSIEQVAFLLVAIYESACCAIDKDLPPGQHTRLVPEVVPYLPGKIQILWRVKKRSEVTGKIYSKREWSYSHGIDSTSQIKAAAHASELKLALKIEKCFVLLREASVTTTALNNTAKRLDEIANMLSRRVRDLDHKYKEHNYGGDIEKIIEGLYEDPDIWEVSTDRTFRDGT